MQAHDAVGVDVQCSNLIDRCGLVSGVCQHVALDGCTCSSTAGLQLRRNGRRVRLELVRELQSDAGEAALCDILHTSVNVPSVAPGRRHSTHFGCTLSSAFNKAATSQREVLYAKSCLVRVLSI